jgi:hypothetical protein
MVQRAGPIRMPAPADLAAWQGNVTRLWGGPNEHVSWLHLDWYDDEDVNRLVLWQMIPIEKCSEFVKGFLCGPPPGKDDFGRQRGIPMVRLQWELAQKLHGWAQAFWIIEGTQGGHKRRFTHVEQCLLKMAGLPTEPPVPGSQPYAPFDNRVIEQVAKLDMMARYDKMLDFADRRPDQLDAEDQETIRSMKREHLKWLERQVDAVFDSVTRADIADATAPRSDAPPLDWDAASDELTNT